MKQSNEVNQQVGTFRTFYSYRRTGDFSAKLPGDEAEMVIGWPSTSLGGGINRRDDQQLISVLDSRVFSSLRFETFGDLCE